MRDKKQTKTFIIWGVGLVLAWAAVAVLLFANRGNLTVEGILSFVPENRLRASLIMLALYALKGVDFIMYSGVLYAASGLMFPIWQALVINAVGMLFMCIIPYVVGKKIGSPFKVALEERYEKLRDAEEYYRGNDFIFTFGLRVLNIPFAPVGFFCGAADLDFLKYLSASSIVLSIDVVIFTILGLAVKDFSSPFYIPALAAKAVMIVITVNAYRRLKKKTSK